MPRIVILILPLILIACASTQGQVVVTSVVDGDTLHVQLTNGDDERVRIVGIDTPETVDPRKPVQCFGEEASARMKELVEGKSVVIEKKPDEDRDRYDRLLRYVIMDGEDIGALMISEGYAFSYKPFPHPKLREYNALEREARTEGRGLWGEGCEYAKKK